MSRNAWPELKVADWRDTRDTLHLWSQVVGKVRLALSPPVNHWWHVPLYVSIRGLTTSPMPYRGRHVEVELDFVHSEVRVATDDPDWRSFPLEPQSVADFHSRLVEALASLGISVDMLARPVEMVEATPFNQDVALRDYDPDAAERFWRLLAQASRVFTVFRGEFMGKVSPVHVFWGALDLAVTRFSGRTAPPHPGGIPNCGDWVMHEAYSHEVSSAGYFADGGTEGAFYSYAYPTPDGFADRPVTPAAAYYDHDLGEFLLPYDVVRTAADPDAVLLGFLRSTYAAAADLGGWDRAALDRLPASVAVPPPVGDT
jgi:hypothetical protein